MARQSWLDEDAQTTVIDDQVQKLESFIDAMADGRVDDREVNAQEQRVVALMKEIEPQLDDATHAKVTELLCELSAFNIMQLMHQVQAARPVTQFQG